MVVAVLAACSATVSGNSAGGQPAAPPAPSIASTAAGSSGASTPAARPPRVTPAAPARTPCTANTRARWILVSLHRQHMWMCARHRVVRDTAVTTGMHGPGTETPTGSYRIQGRNRDTTLTLNTGATYAVRYWIPFDAPLFGFHDSSWQHFPYGSPRYRTAGSHGCVHMPLAAVRFLYKWAAIGTSVSIRA